MYELRGVTRCGMLCGNALQTASAALVSASYGDISDVATLRLGASASDAGAAARDTKP